ncbi:hypothetical protein CEXT_630741 [Caerostris extrusa]|uniref:Uncharacterized protein n=1 Tax=Caerostris extrusa TaxID=172846 RepID=A0AAV4R0F5_CAEEX|nr:hypothetical protein CEXT_630741 [Caerostris extrusa]
MCYLDSPFFATKKKEKLRRDIRESGTLPNKKEEKREKHFQVFQIVHFYWYVLHKSSSRTQIFSQSTLLSTRALKFFRLYSMQDFRFLFTSTFRGANLKLSGKRNFHFMNGFYSDLCSAKK